MEKLIFGLILLASVVLVVNGAKGDEADGMSRMQTKPLKLSVTQHGGKTVQMVDNQQGQIVKQVVSPDGIHQTVFRNGVKITDDVVPAPQQLTQI